MANGIGGSVKNTKNCLIQALLITVLVGGITNPATALQQNLAVSIALGTKLTCSGVFVVGRDAREYLRNDAYPFTGVDWGTIEISVDRDARTLELATPDGKIRKKAVYNGSQGCTLIPDGETGIFFTPAEVESVLPDPTTELWPMGDVIVRSTASREYDEEALQAAVDTAFERDDPNGIPLKTRAFIVLHKGQIVAERYARGYDMNTRHVSWSMGKSITATLVGLLVRDGHFTVDDPAPVREWRDIADPRGKITIADLLHMSSGLDFKRLAGPDYFTKESDHLYVYAAAVDAFALSVSKPSEFPPNTVYRYRNSDPLTLGKIVRETVEARGENYLTFPQRELFDKIGMRNMILEPDPYGNLLLPGFDYGTARDWARFGLLHQQDGMWQGERILPEGWVDYIRTPAPASEGNYGGLWWINVQEGVPAGFYASGARGQRVMVIPSHDLVIVRMGHSIGGGFGSHFNRVTTAVAEAFETSSKK